MLRTNVPYPLHALSSIFQLYRHAGIAQSENIQYDADCTETLVQRTDMSGEFLMIEEAVCPSLANRLWISASSAD